MITLDWSVLFFLFVSVLQNRFMQVRKVIFMQERNTINDSISKLKVHQGFGTYEICARMEIRTDLTEDFVNPSQYLS